MLQYSPEDQKKLVLEAHGKGYQVAIHAQGDRGVDPWRWTPWRTP